VTTIAPQLIKDGRVTESGRAGLGVRVATITGGGVMVLDVTTGGAAAKAGLKQGDIIISLNGKPTPTAAALQAVLVTLKPGQQAQVVVRTPDGQQATKTITLGQLQG
jgi:putative serine protease PepD